MTCIAGVVHNGKVYIGGDSAGSFGHSLNVRADRKVFKSGEFLYGFCGSFRMGQLLQHSLKVPDRNPDRDPHEYMVTDFINAVRECLKAGGYAEKHDDVETGGNFLVGYSGRLFQVESDYQVGEAFDGWDASGSGFEVALGALYATRKLPPRKRIETALEAAERYGAYVRRPFHILSI